MRIGIPAPARVRPRTPGPLVPRPADIYEGLDGLYRYRLRPAGRAGRRVVGATLPWLAAIAIGLFLQFIVLNWPVYRVVTVSVSLLALPAFLKWVELTIIVNLILVSGLVATPRPVTIGGQGLGMHEFMVALGLMVALYKFHVSRPAHLPRSPVVPAMLMFFTAIAISFGLMTRSYLADPRGPFPFREVYNAVRYYFVYLTYFIFLYGIRKEAQVKRVLVAALAISSIVGVLTLVQYLLGPHFRLFFGRVEALETGGGSVTRTIAPGLQLIMVLLPLTMYLAARSPLKNSTWYILLATSLGAGLIFSFARNYWLTSMLSIVILAALLRGVLGTKVVAYALAAVGLALSLAMIIGSSHMLRGSGFGEGLRERFTSSFGFRTTDTLVGRYKEYGRVWAYLKHHWILGAGPDKPLYYRYENRNQRIEPIAVTHNSYLNVWHAFGILGAATFLWLLIAVAYRSVYIYRHASDPFTRAFGASAFAVLVGAAIRAYVTMSLSSEPNSIIAVLTMWGMTESVWVVHENKRLATRNQMREAAG